jgi:hypothetical protein
MFLIHRSTAASELAIRPPSRARWAAVALALGLVACGGSDFVDTAVVQEPPAEAPLIVETPVSLPLFSVHVAFPGTVFGSSDASTALALDANWMLVGDDESNALSVYPRSGGAAVAQWDFSKNGPMLTKELDLEASAKIKDALYLIGSHSNKKDGGDAMADRGHLFAVKIDGTGSATQVTYGGKFSNLETQLVAWDRGNAHGLGVDHFGFSSSAAAGITPERVDGFSIEGLVGAPNDSALWLGFRAPLASTRTSALIVPLSNYAALTAGTTSSAAFGTAIELDLGGRGIRSIDRDDSGNYLIIAGPAGASSAAIERNFALFGWNGNPSSAPQEFDNDLDALRRASAGSFETIVALDGKVAPGSSVQLLMDNGDTLWSGKSSVSKDLPAAEQQFQGVSFQLGAYRVDRQGPLLKVAAPLDDRVGVPVDARIVLQFDEALKLGAGNLTLRRSDGSAVEVFNAASATGRLQVSYNQVTLTPASSLDHLTSYHLTIDGNALTDLKGNAYAGINGADTFNFISAGQATALAIGDLLFVGANAEATDAIAFTVLKDISGGTQVTFSDRDYLKASNFTGITNEGVFRWTADRDIKAGTIITIQTDTAPLSPIADIGTTLGAPAGIGKEEVIYAMVGTVVSKLADGSAGTITSPGQFLASITLGGLGTGGKSPREIPDVLISAGTAMDFSVSPANQTNAIYAGSFDRSSLASFAARIKLKANWDVSYAPAPGYPLTNGSMFAGK